MLLNIYTLILEILVIVIYIIQLFYKKGRYVLKKHLVISKFLIVKNENILWFHAASVGEVNLLKPLIDKFHNKNFYCIVSVNTETGYNQAVKHFSKNRVFYFPVDIPIIINRFLKKIRPKAIIFAETEIWPNILKIANRKGIKLFLVNARLTKKSTDFFYRYSSFFKKLLSNYDMIYCKSEFDLKFYKKISKKNNLKSYGNIKILQKSIDDIILKKKQLLSDIKVNQNDFVFTLGSTRENEEKIILSQISDYLSKDNFKLFVAPRHLERKKEVYELLKKYSNNIEFYSNLKNKKLSKNIKILIIDTYGDLAVFYSISTVAFVGGTLVNIGGHNILEPCYYNIPVIYGKYTDNCKEFDYLLQKYNAGIKSQNIDKVLKKIFEKKLYIKQYSFNCKKLIVENSKAIDMIFNDILRKIKNG